MGRYKRDSTISEDQWNRYVYMRDNGHTDFIRKATKCNQFFCGKQWSDEDRDRLLARRRPALTINKILTTIGTLMGDQIQHRTEIGFRSTHPDFDPTTEALTKLFKHISDDNQLDWLRSEVFGDGIITSRGFYDVRLKFDNNLRGEVAITVPNPKNIVIDPDADEYDPDTWLDVVTTKWLSAEEIEHTYNKDAADELKAHIDAGVSPDIDAVETQRDRFGGPDSRGWHNGKLMPQARLIRILERQYRENTMQEHFVDLQTGDIRPVPENWDQNRISQVASQWKFSVVRLPRLRVRWRTTAGQLVLHDDWSPFKHFTIVPYFPHFRRGVTVGAVENLIDPQEMLNKLSSQELHVVNTTANSGYKVKSGALTTMDISELEERGAETGLVIELNDMDGLEKIEPNQYPSGLDRLSFKAEDHIKSISMVTDTMMGNDREDVAAKAITAKQGRSVAVHAKPMDNLSRSDFFLARAILDIVQTFYSEPRVYNIVTDDMTGKTEPLKVNQQDPISGEIVNDLTMGQYKIIVNTQPAREAFEDSQFEQAMALKEAGVQIPDEVLIQNSRLLNRGQIVQQIEQQKQDPNVQKQQQLAMQLQEAEIAKLQAEVDNLKAESVQRTSKAQAIESDAKVKVGLAVHEVSNADDPAEQRRLEMEQSSQQHAQEMAQAREKHALEMQKHTDTMRMAHEKHSIAAQHQHLSGMQTLSHKQDQHEMQVEHGLVDHGVGMQQNQESHEATLKQKAAAAKAAPKPTSERKQK